jgi:hypothetical protein
VVCACVEKIARIWTEAERIFGKAKMAAQRVGDTLGQCAIAEISSKVGGATFDGLFVKKILGRHGVYCAACKLISVA